MILIIIVVTTTTIMIIMIILMIIIITIIMINLRNTCRTLTAPNTDLSVTYNQDQNKFVFKMKFF